MLKIGDLAKNFALKTPEGKLISLFSKLAESHPLVLIFYKFIAPHASSPSVILPRIAKG